MTKKTKNILVGIVVFVLIVLLGITAYFVALRMSTTEETIAPTAPESEPSAYEDWVGSGDCVTEFSVGDVEFDTGPFECSGHVVIYFRHSMAEDYEGVVTLTHEDGQTDSMTFNAKRQTLTSSMTVEPGDMIKVAIADASNSSKQAVGWVPPDGEICGREPFGTLSLTRQIEEAEAVGQPIASMQCWSDWMQDSLDYDYNDYMLVFSCDGSGTTTTPTETPTTTVTETPTTTVTETPTTTTTTTTTATATPTGTTTVSGATPTSTPAAELAEAGILSLPGAFAFGGGLLMAILGIILAL